MDENPCDDIARQSGFVVPVGNWITPNGDLIFGTDHDTHHWETLKQYLVIEGEVDNNLHYMNERICEGYIRIVIRFDVLFQVHGEDISVVWCDKPNFLRMRYILGKLGDTEVHVFSKKFYMIGSAMDVCNHVLQRLQIQQ